MRGRWLATCSLDDKTSLNAILNLDFVRAVHTPSEHGYKFENQNNFILLL